MQQQLVLAAMAVTVAMLMPMAFLVPAAAATRRSLSMRSLPVRQQAPVAAVQLQIQIPVLLAVMACLQLATLARKAKKPKRTAFMPLAAL